MTNFQHWKSHCCINIEYKDWTVHQALVHKNHYWKMIVNYIYMAGSIRRLCINYSKLSAFIHYVVCKRRCISLRGALVYYLKDWPAHDTENKWRHVYLSLQQNQVSEEQVVGLVGSTPARESLYAWWPHAGKPCSSTSLPLHINSPVRAAVGRKCVSTTYFASYI